MKKIKKKGKRSDITPFNWLFLCFCFDGMAWPVWRLCAGAGSRQPYDRPLNHASWIGWLEKWSFQRVTV